MSALASAYFLILSFGQIRHVVEAAMGSYFFRYEYILVLYFFTPVLLLYSLLLNGKIRIPSDFLILLLLAFYPLVTLFFQYDVNYSLKYVLSDLLMPTLFFLALAFSRGLAGFENFVINRFAQYFFWISISTVFISLSFDVNYLSLLMIQFIFSALIYSHLYGGKYKLLIYLAIFLSGKRSLWVALPFLGKLSFKLFVSLCFFAVVIFVYDLLPYKYYYTFERLFLEGGIFDSKYSARFEEVDNVLEIMREQPWYSWITGVGAGFYYYILDSAGVEQISHNVHFSPLGLTSTYGLPYAFLVYFYLLSLIVRFKVESATDKVFYLYAIISILYSFLAYSLFVDFLVLVSFIYIRNKLGRK